MSITSRLVPAMIALSAACMAGPAMAENLQGHGKGFIIKNLGLTQNGAPLLQSFYFRYSDADHHISAIEVAPNVPAANKASLAFSDKNRDDAYFYNVTFAPYFGEIFRRTDAREHCTNGTCTYPIQGPPNRADYVFVLRGFYIYYVGDDHHIDQIKIQENDGKVTVAFNDQNDDDRFRVDLHYAYIPKSRFSVVDERSGTAKGGQRVTIPGGTAVIRGFDFNFKSKDHHIKDFGVMQDGNGRMEVFYGDKNQDDTFDWNVQYAVLSARPTVLDPHRPVLDSRSAITD